VIQLGENPEKVYKVGGLGIDGIRKLDLLEKEELQNALRIKFQSKSLLVTFHPATLENDSAETQMKELLSSLSKLSDTTIIFTLANADTGGQVINSLIDKFIANHEYAFSYTSLGQRLYFSCIKEVDGVIGNSSSGLTEVPTFKKGTVNIGDRQMGRVQADSVINCSAKASEISRAIDELYSEDFNLKIMRTINPYGEGGASERVVKVLREIPLEGLTKKYFYDL
jgi:GDP/UDP-N,N'-diacetylbacillosamine 2-epimerase (hydrolysing)